MPPYLGAHLISYRHYDRMHSPTRPEQHENSFSLATSSGSPSAPLKIIPTFLAHQEALYLFIYSNCHNFRHVGVNGTQSTSQTLFPMQKNNLTGGEYMSTKLYQYQIFRGTGHQGSYTYTPGIAERKKRNLLETVGADECTSFGLC